MAASATSTEKHTRPAKLRRATLADLTGKKAMRDEFSVPFGPDKAEVTFLFVSIGAKRYDVLLAKFPPDTAQRAAGATFNSDTFAPALLAEVCVEPAIDAAGWAEVWNSDNWNRGEVSALFWRAVELCNARVDVNPIGAG
jgi:hypothetical protein